MSACRSTSPRRSSAGASIRRDFVRDVFEVEPDAWQVDVLEAFPHQQRLAMACCKGPGKTTVLAWLIWNFLLTRPHPKIAATAITKDNLDDNLWAELAKWQKRSRCCSGYLHLAEDAHLQQ